jgi:hypothetical protein
MPWSPSDADRFKDGLSESEKEQWAETANSALESCLNDGGEQDECEAAAIRQANGVVGNRSNDCDPPVLHRSNLGANYQTRTENFMGRRHLVAPVVLMVEGVHNGSQGPTLYTSEELAKFPPAWNGRPLPVMHPEDEIGPVSCNSPEIIEQQSVGWLFNVHYSEGPDGDKPGLYGEIWVDEQRAQEVSPVTLQAIRNGEGLEVSTGVFNDPERTGGTWNGEEYHAIARNLRPDHLALLPGERGACSWEDGCGVRANKEKRMPRRTNRLQAHKQGCGCEACQNANQPDHNEGGEQGAPSGKEHPLSANQADEGYSTLIRSIQAKLDAMDGENRLHFLEELYDDRVIYRVSDMSSGSDTLYQRGYEVGDDGQVSFMDDRQEVRRKVDYQPVGEEPANQNEHGKNEEVDMAKVDQLIANEQTNFSEDDREWLANLSEAQVDKLFPAAPAANSQADNKVTKEEAVEALRESIQDKDSFLNLLPSDMREQFSHGLALHQQRRTELIDRVTANSDVYTKEELEAKPIDEIEKLASLVKPQVNHAPLGGGQAPTDNSNQDAPSPLLPTGVEGAE